MKKLLLLAPYIFIVFFGLVFFYPFFFKQLLPIPADILPGVYFPWLDLSYPGLPAGVPVKNALPSDIVSLTYPLRLLSINLFKAGQWPLWNPYILSGTPLLANFQSAALNPLNILYFLPINFPYIWSVQVILQPILATLFLYIFLRSNKLTTTAALYGSFVWGFGGFIAIWSGYNTVIHAILTLPLALWSVQEVGRKKVSGPLFALSVCYSILAGNPPMTIILLLVSALYAIWLHKLHLPVYVTLLIYLLLSLGISAPLLLTGMQTSAASIRNVDTIAFTSNIKFLPLFKLITISAPDFFGNPSTLNLWSNAGLYDNLTVYLGAIPFMFFIASFFHYYLDNKQRLVRFFWFLFFLSLVLAIRNPLSVYIGSLQFLGLSSMVMTRFTVLTGISVAICSAIVIDEVLSGRSKFINWRASLTISIGTIFIFILLSLGVGLLAKHTMSSLLFGGKDVLVELISFSRIATRNSVLPILLIFTTFLLLSALLLWPNQAFRQGKWSRIVVIFLIFTLTFFEIFRFYHKYNTFTRADYLYPKTPITDFLQSQPGRFAREIGEIIPSNTWMPYQLFSASGYDTLHSLRYNQFLSLLAGNHLTDTSSRYAEVKNYRNQFFDFLGIKNIVLIKRTLGVPDKNGSLSGDFESKYFPKAFESDRSIIISNPRAFPLVYSVPSVQVSHSIQESEKLLLSLDLHTAAITEKEPIPLPNGITQIDSLTLSPQAITFSTTATTSSYVVTSTTFDSGWRLYVDNQEKEVYVTNHAFIGFPLTSGSHTVRLEYIPPIFKYSLYLSLSSLIVLVTSLIYLMEWPQHPK